MYTAAKPVAGGSFFDKNVPQIVLKSLFTKYDKDGSGQLNRLELQGLFVDDLGLSKEQAESYAYLLDKDGNGKVSFEEFNSWLHSGEKFKNVNDKSRYQRLKKAVELFKSYDKDGSGALDKDEFEKLFIAYGGKKQNVGAGLKELDKDGNGVISFEEMMRWLRWIPVDD
ncbi:calmodulin-like protein 3 [Rhopilema esculentum]|uniref:calmodulin-like protein 3 n=1 Tax=Rhopilema esculentum TaxID=499914 RepID=UPI0031D9F5D8|eukprot:gene3157-1461_t